MANVTFERRAVPEQWPDGAWDLIVFSEILYFVAPGSIPALARAAEAALRPGGCMLLVDWLGATDTELSGEEAADLFLASLASADLSVSTQRQPGFRLDCVLRPPGAAAST